MGFNVFRAIAEIVAVLMASVAGLIVAAILFQTPYASPFGMLAGVGAAIFFIKLRGEALSDFGFRGAGILKTILLVAAVFVAAIVLFIFFEPVLERWFGPIDFSVFDPLEDNAGLFILMLAVSWVGAAFGEEVVHRGFIMTRLAQVFSLSAFGWIVAVVVHAVIFALLHSYQGWVGVIEIFFLAIAIGVAYLAAGRSLIPVIIVHGLIDTFAMTDFYLGGALTDWIALAH